MLINIAMSINIYKKDKDNLRSKTMKKAKAIFLFSAILAVLALALASCQRPTDAEDNIKAATYTVSYQANGATSGTVPTASTAYKEGETVTVAENSGNLEKTNYYYAGWNTAANGSGTSYAPGATFKMVSADVVLYAQWSEVPTFTVTYNANGAFGGAVPAPQIIQENALVTVSVNVNTLHKNDAPPVTQESFNFLGWNTSADGSGTHYNAGSGSFTVTTDTTLYAEWGPYQMRDQGPAGGWIIYDKGSFSNDWRYIEAAPEDISAKQEWGTSGTTTGATGINVGDGKQNTDLIIANDSTSEAALACTNLSLNRWGITYDDWYLPSENEFNRIDSVLYSEPNDYGLKIDKFYWTSTEDNSNVAIHWDFTFNYANIAGKTNLNYIRCIRYF